MSSSYSNTTTYPPVRRRSGGTNPELDRALQELLLNSLGITPTHTTTTTTPSMTSSATTSSFYWPPGLGTERGRPRSDSASASDMNPLSQRLAEMIMEAFIDPTGSGSGSSTTRPMGMGMGMGGRPAPSAPATPGMGTEWTNRPPLRSEYHEMMQLYHQNMMECNYTTQMIIDGLVASRTRSRNGIHEIYNTGGAYFATMREYHRTMEDSLRLYSDFYFGFNSYDDRNYTTPPRGQGQTHGAVPTAGRTTTTGTGTGTRSATGATSTSPLPVVTRPHRFVRYTVFPYVTPTVEPNEQPLTETQIQEVTQEYVWSGTNEVGGGVGGAADISGAAMATVCPITLDAFQPGEHISRILHCGHEFKSSSLRRWFQRSSQCPLCRCNVLSPGVAPRRSRAPTMGEVVDISGVVAVTDLSGNMTTLVVPTPAPAPIPVVGPDSPTPDDTDIVDRLHPLVEAFARQLYLQEALPSNIYHDHDHQTFHDMLMNSAEPPPRVTHPDENYPRLQGNLEGDNSIPDLEPILRALLQDHGSGPIESIDITYTVDYDVSGNG